MYPGWCWRRRYDFEDTYEDTVSLGYDFSLFLSGNMVRYGRLGAITAVCCAIELYSSSEVVSLGHQLSQVHLHYPSHDNNRARKGPDAAASHEHAHTQPTSSSDVWVPASPLGMVRPRLTLLVAGIGRR